MKWHHRFLELAKFFARWSKDPSTQVGAVIIDGMRRVVGEGYNGFPRGIDDTEARLNDRPTKYAHMVHAEANAILNAIGRVQGCVIYCTHFPCANCAKLIIQSGLAKVYVPAGSFLSNWQTEQEQASGMLAEAGITIEAVSHGD